MCDYKFWNNFLNGEDVKPNKNYPTENVPITIIF